MWSQALEQEPRQRYVDEHLHRPRRPPEYARFVADDLGMDPDEEFRAIVHDALTFGAGAS